MRIGQKREREREGAYEPIRLLDSKTGKKKGWCYGRKGSEAMNVVGGSKREKIVESRLGSIEKNQNRNIKGVFRPKKKKEQKWFYPKLELKIK